MKILLISNMFPKDENDFYGVFVKNIEEGLIGSSAEVDRIVIAGRGKGIFEKLKKYFYFYISIFNANFNEYDFIHLSYPSHTYLPCVFKSFKHSKLIVRLHGNDLMPINIWQRLLFIFTKYSIIRADMVVVPSNYFYDELCKINKPKDYFIYPSGGLDLTRFYPLDRESNSEFTIGSVGRLDSGKGIEVLINAVSRLSFNFKLIIVGSGEMEENLKQQASKTSKAERIDFVGKIANSNLIYYYNQFDVFVFPTMRVGESFGNVAIEAMGCKVPIIGSKMAGLLDYIYDGTNGYFFEPGNDVELTEKISIFYNLSKQERKNMEQEAFKIAMSYEKKYLSKLFANKLLKLK